MAKRQPDRLLSSQNTITLGTAAVLLLSMAGGLVYIGGWLKDYQRLKEDVDHMRPIVDDMKASLDFLKGAAQDKGKKGR